MNSAKHLLANSMLAKLTPGSYLLFVDAIAVDVAALAAQPMPIGIDIVIVPVAVGPGGITEAICLLPVERLAEFTSKEKKK